jgi:hypothetical protein
VKTAALLLAAVMLTGCSTFANLIGAGSKVNDAAAEGAEVTICRAISIGAWMRAYGSDPAKAKAWRELCSDQIGELP